MKTDFIKKELFEQYSTNPFFVGTGISSNNGITSIMIYWKIGSEEFIKTLPSTFEGVELKHIITGEIKLF